MTKVVEADFDRVLLFATGFDQRTCCVIVKDLSRFGRNHIETGYYIEKYFSRRGIRFISVNDHAETIDGITNLNPYGPKNIPLINLMNEAASNELSKSKQSILNGYASDGKYIAPRAPYGYRKDPDDCHIRSGTPPILPVVHN